MSQDMAYTYLRRFFMCANYDTEPMKVGPYDPRPPVVLACTHTDELLRFSSLVNSANYICMQSPEPLCDYIQWIDLTQTPEQERELQAEAERRRERWESAYNERERELRNRRFQEARRKEKEEAERIATEAREAERARKRELARKGKEEGLEVHTSHIWKGKYPKFS